MYGPVVLPREQQGFLATATQHAPIPVMCDELVGVLVMTELIDGLLIVHRDVRVLHRPGRRVVPVHLFHTGLPLPLVDGHRGYRTGGLRDARGYRLQGSEGVGKVSYRALYSPGCLGEVFSETELPV
jgi:hypothetical protein